MARHYKRKTKRANTPLNIMERALKEVNSGRSVHSVADSFGMDRMTLTRFKQKRENDKTCTTGYASIAETQAVFSDKMETALADHIKQLSEQFHGLSLLKCCTLAYEFAIQNNLKVPENWKRDKRAGFDWWLRFKDRQHLSVRSPEAP